MKWLHPFGFEGVFCYVSDFNKLLSANRQRIYKE